MPGSDQDQITQLSQRGLAAAVTVARQQGLTPVRPEVLSVKANLVVRLAPDPVVARVAILAGATRADPFCWLAREVAVATYVHGRGGPVVAPTPLADPGPHRCDGLAVSLWTHVQAGPQRPEAAQAGRALGELHLAAAGFPGELGLQYPVRDQVSECLAILERDQALPARVLATLRHRHAAMLAELDAAGAGPPIVLHGDAHPGNLLLTGSGWLWLDLEETCRGPRELDLAIMADYLKRNGAAAAVPAALAGYAEVTGESPDPGALASFERARQLEDAVWAIAVARQYPARYGEAARQHLAGVLQG